MSNKNTITIVTASDNTFSLLLATLIKSIEVNHLTGEPIDLYIINDGISKKNLEKLNRTINTEMFSVKWKSVKEVIPKGMILPVDNSTFPKTAYLRLFIPYFVPENIDKILYLDVDMLVVDEISKLWNTNIEGSLAGGVVDRAKVVSSSWGGIKNYKELGLDPDTKYFNSGLLLFNPALWRKLDISNKVLSVTKQNSLYTGFADQYGLNVVLANKWLELDSKWNSYAQLDEKNPSLIHFTGVKPIYKNYCYNEEYKSEFFKYLRMTEWKNFQPVGGYHRFLKKLQVKVEKICKRIFNQHPAVSH